MCAPSSFKDQPFISGAILPELNSCEIQMSQTSYSSGEVVSTSTFRLVNFETVPLAVELKTWLEIPTSPPASIINMGTDGSFILPLGFDQDFGPVDLFPTEGLPLGTYGISCRLLDPVTGALLSEDRDSFTIQ